MDHPFRDKGYESRESMCAAQQKFAKQTLDWLMGFVLPMYCAAARPYCILHSSPIEIKKG